MFYDVDAFPIALWNNNLVHKIQHHDIDTLNIQFRVIKDQLCVSAALDAA